MQVIYQNKIWDVSKCQKADETEEKYEISLASESSTIKIEALSFEHYEYEDQPLLFIKQEMTDAQKLILISKMDEWYGNTDQDTIDYALEFAVVVRMILCDYLVINPRYLEIEEVLQDILEIVI